MTAQVLATSGIDRNPSRFNYGIRRSCLRALRFYINDSKRRRLVMETSSYYVALEFYVKYHVNFKSLDTAKENGTYDKAITRLALDFTF